MQFLSEPLVPNEVLPPPDTRDWWTKVVDTNQVMHAQRQAYADKQWYVDNPTSAPVDALSQAYSQRIAAVKSATGVTLDHPFADLQSGVAQVGMFDFRKAQEEKFQSDLKTLAIKHPDQVAVLQADVPMMDQAKGIAFGFAQNASKADAAAQAAGITPTNQFINQTAGSFYGMVRDPMNVASLFVGGPEAAGAKTVAGRVLQRVATDAAINGGVQIPVQFAAENWRRQSGTALGTAGVWQEVGLAAAFGGGLGGLFQGGHEVFKALGKATPETTAALQRIQAGQPTPEDLHVIANAVGAPLQPAEIHDLSTAIQNDLADSAVLAKGADAKQVAQVIHSLENNGPVPPTPLDNLPPPNFKFFNPQDLKVDAARFQFKEGGDAQGVTTRLKGVTNWKPERAGTAVVFEDDAGNSFVADGHQRTGLAARIQEQSGQAVQLPAYVFRAADGYSADDVRLIAALKNIGEGTGSAIDAAKVLRNGSVDLKSSGLPINSAIVRDGAGLAKLSPDAFTMAVNEVIDPKLSAVIGRLVNDPQLHAQMIDVLKHSEAKTLGDAESMVRDMLAEPTVVEHQNTLFGEEDLKRMLLKEKAQVRATTLRNLKKDKAVFNSLVEEQNRIASHGNILDAAANSERANADAILIETIDRLSRQVGPISQALNTAAREVASGASAAKSSQAFVDAVREEIRKSGGNLARIGEQQSATHLIDPAIAGTKFTEPATHEAAQAANDALKAAGGEHIPTAAELEAQGQNNMFGAAEPTSQGLQVLIPGVEPVTIKMQVDTAAAKPMTGGHVAPPAGGLFDDVARAQLDIMDALPAGTSVDGKPLLTTHAELVSQSERVDHLADVIASCKG